MGDSIVLEVITSGLERVEAKLDQLSGKLNRVSDAEKKAEKHTSRLASMFKSLALRMAMRAIIRGFLNAIREGVQNLYQYSAAVNNADQAMAKNTMDKYASGFLYLKNSLGAMVMPILQSLIPLFNTITNAVITALNAINMFFAALSGASFFTKAKKNAVDWGKSAAGAAGGAAKALKDYIMGWDELNVIHPDTGGGGGGGGGGGLNYGDMFENADINAELVEKLTAWTALLSPLLFGLGAAVFIAGHPGLGIALMLAGYAGATAIGNVNWDLIPSKTKSALGAVAAFAMPLLWTVGLVALFGGHFAIGMGLIAASALTAKMLSENWDYVPEKTRKAIQTVAGFYGPLATAIGLALLFTGPAGAAVGVGLITSGIAAMAINWNWIVEKVRSVGDAIHSYWENTVVARVTSAWDMVRTTFEDNVASPIQKKLEEMSPWWNKYIFKPFKDAWNVFAEWWNVNIAPFLDNVFGLKTYLPYYETATGKAVSMTQSMASKIRKEIDSIPSTKRVSVTLGLTGNTVVKARSSGSRLDFFMSAYAHGGYPTIGDLFIANETGPELVGTVNGRNAVASNNEITGISDTIRETSATTAALLAQLIQTTGNSTIKVGEREFGEVVRDSLNYLSRTQGSNGLVMGGI